MIFSLDVDLLAVSGLFIDTQRRGIARRTRICGFIHHFGFSERTEYFETGSQDRSTDSQRFLIDCLFPAFCAQRCRSRPHVAGRQVIPCLC